MRGTAARGTSQTAAVAFDPHGLFNPGRIVDTPPITAHLRFGAGYLTPNPPTYFDYAALGGHVGEVRSLADVLRARKAA